MDINQAFTEHTRIGPIMENCTNLLKATPEGKKAAIPPEMQAIAVLAFKLHLIQTCGPKVIESVFPELNKTLAMVNPDLDDLRKGKA